MLLADAPTENLHLVIHDNSTFVEVQELPAQMTRNLWSFSLRW